MNTETFALDFKFCQAMLCKEREEVAQLVHRELLLWTARLILLMAATPAITVSARRASCALRLSGCLLRSFLACGLCPAFLVAHSRFNSKQVFVDSRSLPLRA